MNLFMFQEYSFSMYMWLAYKQSTLRSFQIQFVFKGIQSFPFLQVARVSNDLQLVSDSRSFSIFLLLVILSISPNLDAVNLQLLSSNHRLLEVCPRVFFFSNIFASSTCDQIWNSCWLLLINLYACFSVLSVKK